MKIELMVEEFNRKHEAFIISCDSLEESGEWNVEELGEMDAFYSNDLASVVIRLIAIDGKITKKEVAYLNKTFGFDYSLEELEELYRNSKDDIGCDFDESFENGISYMRKIHDGLANAYKELLALICKIIIESDGVVTAIEEDEVKKLISMCE